MNLIRNLISADGVYQGVPATLITLTSEPTQEWIERVPDLMMHSHVVIDGDDPLKWNLDALLTEIHQHTALYFIQVITSGNYPYVGKVKPSWLTIRVTASYPEEWHLKLGLMASEVIFYVNDELDMNRVQEITGMIRDFTLAVSFVPFTDEFRAKAIKMTLSFDQHYSGWGQAKYIEPIFEEE